MATALPYYMYLQYQVCRVCLVHFNVLMSTGGICWSKVGTDAKQEPPDKPTMQLSLKGHPQYFQRYLVILEFGHVLGLQHEHQRSDFWRIGLKFLDLSKILNDDRLVGHNVQEDLFELPPSGESSEYDPDSIMHYW